MGSKIAFAYNSNALLVSKYDTNKHPKMIVSSSVGFGIIIKGYHFCKTWSDVKFSVNQIKSDIRKLSKADASNFTIGYNRYRSFQSCDGLRTQSSFESDLNKYLSNLKTEYNKKHGIVTPPENSKSDSSGSSSDEKLS